MSIGEPASLASRLSGAAPRRGLEIAFALFLLVVAARFLYTLVAPGA